jgi:hypothetical protein
VKRDDSRRAAGFAFGVDVSDQIKDFPTSAPEIVAPCGF